MVTSKVLEAFRVLVKRTITNIINDTINDRLKSAISKPDSPIPSEPPTVTIPTSVDPQEKEIVTTQEELEGYYIVRSILRQKVTSNRITHRDALSYFAIFLDDNNRKPLCRLYLNNSKKYIGLFDSDKKESKVEIQTIDDIYNFGSQLDNTIEIYLDAKK